MPSTCIIITVAVWAAVTEHHRLGGLSHKHLHLTVLETRKYKIKAQQTWCVVRAYFLVCWSSHGRNRKRQREIEEASFLASYEGTNPIMKAPLSGTNYLSMTPFPDIIMLGTRALTWIWEGYIHCHMCVLVPQSCPALCGPMDCSPQAPRSMELSRQEHWSG